MEEFKYLFKFIVVIFILVLFIALIGGICVSHLRGNSPLPAVKVDTVTLYVDSVRIVEHTKVKYVKQIDTFYVKQSADTIREGYGKPIIINSGYRCPTLNKAVGGVADSYHQKGLAVDIRWDDKLIPYIMENAKFDKMIREHSSSGVRWIHIQWHSEAEKDKDLNKVFILNV